MNEKYTNFFRRKVRLSPNLLLKNFNEKKYLLNFNFVKINRQEKEKNNRF